MVLVKKYPWSKDILKIGKGFGVVFYMLKQNSKLKADISLILSNFVVYCHYHIFFYLFQVSTESTVTDHPKSFNIFIQFIQYDAEKLSVSR